MIKSDLIAGPIFHGKRDSIEAHLSVVMTALAIGKTIEQNTGLSIKKFIKNMKPIHSGIFTITLDKTVMGVILSKPNHF